jgi:hypothetical protein
MRHLGGGHERHKCGQDPLDGSKARIIHTVLVTSPKVWIANPSSISSRPLAAYLLPALAGYEEAHLGLHSLVGSTSP